MIKIHTKMNEKFLNKIVTGDALKLLNDIEDGSIDLVLTDPPYFLDKLDNEWNQQKVSLRLKSQLVVKSLPAGMKFDREQGKRFYEWYSLVSSQLFRVLKPGGFFFSFSSPRLYHRMASAVDDAGFEVRDMFLWLYTQNQMKAMGLAHFIDKLRVSSAEKDVLKEELRGWKTPQVKSCFEPIVMAQKPTDGTYLSNIQKHHVGLVNTNIRIGDGMFPSNVSITEPIHKVLDRAFLLPKPSQEERGVDNIHETVKPLVLCQYIIALTAFAKDAVVLDPFVGSGTTALAADRLGKQFIGLDINKSYVEIARRRLKKKEIVSSFASFIPITRQPQLLA